MAVFKDLTGERIGRLVIMERAESIIQKNGKLVTRWLCKCDCGTTKIIRADTLGRGTNSCGCLKHELDKKQHTNDPVKFKRLYRIWCGMKQRCYNKNSKAYKDYGERGIQVCENWIDNYREFERWALKNGYNDDLTIDRIDNNGNYEPCNCRWATRLQQNKNRRNNVYITYNGNKILLKDYAEKNNIDYKCLHSKYLRYKRKNINYELSKI